VNSLIRLPKHDKQSENGAIETAATTRRCSRSQGHKYERRRVKQVLKDIRQTEPYRDEIGD